MYKNRILKLLLLLQQGVLQMVWKNVLQMQVEKSFIHSPLARYTFSEKTSFVTTMSMNKC